MKKVLFALLTLSFFAVACGPKGPTPEELEAAKQDSIRIADSTAAVVAAAEAAMKAKEDSIKVADSLAAVAAKGKGKKK